MQGDLLGREPIEITCQAWNRLPRLQCNRQEAAAAIKRAAAQFLTLADIPLRGVAGLQRDRLNMKTLDQRHLGDCEQHR